MRIRRILAGLLSLSLVVAACGDDDATSADDAETTTTSTTAAPDDAASTGDDQSIAESALLQLSDFPDGWQEQPPDEDEVDDTESQQRIADCIGVDYERIYGEDADADSPTFASPEGAEVSNSAGVEASEEEAAFAFETLSSDTAIDCIAQEFQNFLAERAPTDGVEVGEVSINRMSFADQGEESAAYRVTVPLVANGQEVDVYVDIVVARVGRGGVTVQALSIFEPFPTEDLARYTEIAVDRLTQALGEEATG